MSGGCGVVSQLQGLNQTVRAFCFAQNFIARRKTLHDGQGWTASGGKGSRPASPRAERKAGTTGHVISRPARPIPQYGRAGHTLFRPFAAGGCAMRIYNAICELIEAHAARVRTDTIECELENVDWAKSGGWADDETN